MRAIEIKNAFTLIRNGANIQQDKSRKGFPITRIESISDNKLDLDKLGYAGILDDSFSEFYLQPGDILMSHINSVSHLGKVAIVDDSIGKIIHGMNLLCLRADTRILSPKYAFYYFRTPSFLNSLKRITKKSVNQASFNISNLRALKIPILESIEDQTRIATVLSRAEALIAQRKESIRLLDEFLKSTFLEMFGDPVKNEKGWQTISLEALIDSERGISYGIVQRGEDQEKGIPVVRIRDIERETFVIEDFVKTKKEISDGYQKTILKGGEILISIRGTLGKVCIAPAVAKGWNISREVAIIPSNEKINKVFLLHLLKSKPMQRKLEGNRKGVAQSGINLEDLRKYAIIDPQKDLQNHFSQIAKKIEAVKFHYQTSLHELENLYGSLSQRAFKGKLDLNIINLEGTPQVVTNQQVSIKPISEFLQENLEPINLESSKPLSESIKEALDIEQVQSYREFEEPVISAELLANEIIKRFKGYHFNFEMLTAYLNRKGLKYHPYRSSEETRMTKALDDTEDLKYFIHSAITNASKDELEQNTKNFLKIDQYFYNALTENFVLKLHDEDYELIKERSKEKRSGIYFSIAE